MPWPLSQDYNEAIQNPSTCFQDAELKQGEAVCNALGLPVPCSGNFADVYAVQSGNKKWAVKCFTRQIPGLQERYVHISKYLQQVNLPFMVEFSFLEKGIQVRGNWYPALKMQWVEGFALNAFIRDNLDKPQVLQTLAQIWLRMAARLREANLAHCDLQHGNVLLVPGSKAGSLGVKLVDYDGMCVPALELLKSIELGHANYQHPQRLKEGSYGLQIDRFPHLVIYTAIKALSVGGKALWDKFENGDNLLFTQKDFAGPTKAAVFQELLKSSDAEVRKLTQALAQAAQKPIDQVPLLDELVGAKPVTKTQPAAPAASKPAVPSAEDVFAAATGPTTAARRTKYDAQKKSMSGVAIAAGIGALVLIGGITAFMLSRGGSPTSKAEVVAEVHKTQASQPTHEATRPVRPSGRERTDTRPQGKVDPNPEPPVEPKKEPKEEPKAEPMREPTGKRYLSDMSEIDPKVGWGKFGKNGDLGFEAYGTSTIMVDGKKYPKGLSMVPAADGNASVKYRLGKSEKAFIASVALSDTAADPQTALTFVVLGDDKILWKSKPIKARKTAQDCRVDVTGVDTLELRVDCPGFNGSMHAVWLDPYVTAITDPKDEAKEALKNPSRVDLLNRIDLAKDSVAGKWTLDGKTLVSPPSDAARFQLQYVLPREYDLLLKVQRKQGTNAFVVGLVCDGSPCMASFDVFYEPAHMSGLQMIDGQPFTSNETLHRGNVFQDGKSAEIVCSVRKKSVVVSVDGKKLFSFKGEGKRLTSNPVWAIPNREALYVGSWQSVYAISKIELTIGGTKPEPKNDPKIDPKKEPVVVDNRLPVPTPEAQMKVEKEIRDVFKTEYARKQPADRLALAAKLFDNAKDSKDDAVSRFVLLREARDLAALAGDLAQSLKAVDAIAKDYAVNAVEMKTTVMEAMGRGALTALSGKTLVEQAFAFADDAITVDDYTMAARLLKLADTVATRMKNVAQTAIAHARARDIDPLRLEWQRSKEAVETLATNPDDKGANLIVGRFLCLMKGQWEQGLPYLAKGSDTRLAALAQRELSAPTDAVEQITLGDAWRDLGKTEPSRAKTQSLRRAYAWYEEALAKGKTVTRTKAEQRLAELDKLISNPQLTILYARYGGANTWIDVTAKVQQYVQGPKLSCKIEDVYNSDPASGVHKSIIVVYQFGEGTYLTIKGNSVTAPLSIPAGPEQVHKRLAVGILGQPFTVIHSEYGGDTGWLDVTGRLAKFSKDGRIVVTPTTDMSDVDPAPNKYKTLVVIYKAAGKLRPYFKQADLPAELPPP
jgi:hypothetical protein